jgi:hypothetical protein
MKKVYTYLLCILCMQLAAVGISSAQAPTLALKLPPTAVVIDGNSMEWGDSLSYYNTEKKIHYTLANDKDNLYLVVKTNDPIQESNILNAGLTFSIDTKGRKKSTYSVTFPEASSMPMKGGQTLEEKSIRIKFIRLKKIAISGFNDISEDNLPTSNTYGIQVAIDYDQKGNLVYEEAIPLALFHAGELAKNDWSFNIKINGVEKTNSQSAIPDMTSATSSTSGRGGGGSGGRGSGKRGSLDTPTFQANDSTTPIDFWGKFSLAKAQ